MQAGCADAVLSFFARLQAALLHCLVASVVCAVALKAAGSAANMLLLCCWHVPTAAFCLRG
jgi:hypothetical protein